MPENLSEIEIRVLGSLIEKQMTTPEYYPLTMNALAAACNQKSNREPVASYGETELLTAVDALRDKNLVYLFYGSNSRAVKYKHMTAGVYGLDEAETAVLAVLMLRGPQTLGEIRERTGRLFEFGGIGEVSEKLDRLTARDEPLVTRLERRPGQKEARYAHLLGDEITLEPATAEKEPDAVGLASEVAALRRDLDALRTAFDEFKKQFG